MDGQFVSHGRWVTLNSVNLHDHISRVHLRQTWTNIETTSEKSLNRTFKRSLAGGQVVLEFHQDYTAGETHATINSILGTEVLMQIFYDPTEGASRTKRLDCNVLISEYTPITDGTHEDLATFSVTFPIVGAISYPFG
jgi:hypothetical protein